MDSLGWSVIGKEKFAFRVESDEETIVIYLTDLASLFCERLTGASILKLCQELNPLIETTVKSLIKQLQSLLTTSKEKWDVEFESQTNDIATVKLTTELDNLPFSWAFRLTRQPPDQFRAFVSLPLLAMLKEATSVEEELCNIIRNKDKQIDDYKASGAAVSRRHLETKEFIAEEFFSQRAWCTIEKSIKEKAPTLFCHVLDRFKKLYSVILQRILSEREKLDLPAFDASLLESAETFPQRDQTPNNKSPPKESEANRLEAVRKRLREEEQKELAKRAKAKKKKK